MSTEPEYVDMIISRLREGRVVFTHSPEMWQECRPPVELEWNSVLFNEDNRGLIPSDEFGIYVFMLEPNLSGPPKSAYILYIGQTGNSRGFRRRYGDYLYYQRTGERIVISRMLRRWRGHLKFYYAPVEDGSLLNDVETMLLNACVPPYNDKFEGHQGPGINAFIREMGG